MAHAHDTAKVELDSDDAWLRQSASVTRMVKDWADRRDLVAYVGEKAAKRNGRLVAPAFYMPDGASIEVNSDACFGKTLPEDVNLDTRDGMYEVPAGVGAVLHEAMHAKHTRWDLKQASEDLEKEPNVHDALMSLEEGRIERFGVQEYPKDRVFLRASALRISLRDASDEKMAEMSGVRQAASLAQLTLARVDAGVLHAGDVRETARAIQGVLGADLLKKLRDIWQTFQRIKVSNTEQAQQEMYRLAREWEKLVKEEADKQKDESGDEDGDSDSEEHGEGAGQAGGKGIMDSLLDALQNDADTQSSRVGDEIAEQQGEEAAERAEKERREAQIEKGEAQQESERVFQHNNHVGPTGKRTKSELADSRTPTAAERSAAVRISKELIKAKYRDAEKRPRLGQLPPGRLDTRAVVDNMAVRARGGTEMNPQWRAVERMHVDDPKMIIGVMGDISGSMSRAMEPMAVTSWILSEAARRIDGKAAVVYFGHDVFPGLNPGQRLHNVTSYTAADSEHAFGKAFQALDGALHLLDGTGPRLLVVVSDGGFGRDEGAGATKWLKRCQQAGVAVLWIGHGTPGWGQGGGGRFWAEDYTDQTDAVFMRPGPSVTDDADLIGRTAAQALTRVGSRR